MVREMEECDILNKKSKILNWCDLKITISLAGYFLPTSLEIKNKKPEYSTLNIQHFCKKRNI